MRHLVLVLGDQLDHESTAFDGFDAKQDVVWMSEVEEECTRVPAHKLRIAYFLSCMRHFRDELAEKGYEVEYHELQRRPSDDLGRSHRERLSAVVNRRRPDKLVVVQPGDFRVLDNLRTEADALGVELEVRPDRHFFCSPEEFADWADGRKELVMEYFYREMRKRHDVLLTSDGKPVGGEWNFDKENRETFGRKGPGEVKGPHRFWTDAVTDEVVELVEHRFGDHPGTLENFDLPVTHEKAREMLRDFIRDSLPDFGTFEDAMWTDEPFLYHSRLSAPLNLKLISARECVELAVEAYEDGHAAINNVEGFVRQILGWREFIRGVYWLKMPEYADLNALDQRLPVPTFFWDGETDMTCVRQSMKHVVQHGYAHHIHRLMVLGNLAQTLGVHPYAFHGWHVAMYVDAVDWVSLPNTLGMSQYGDGGVVGTKPYCSTGNYVDRMSNFCKQCPYDPKKRTGDDACPFSTLYWDFLDRHAEAFENNHRMGFAMKNLSKRREDTEEMQAIRDRAEALRQEWIDPSHPWNSPAASS